MSPLDKCFSNKCQILTGANYSGKSIYLKQLGCLVFLSHIGSFVPARLCKLGLFDALHTLINSPHNHDFKSELASMARISQSATNRSVVLVDEFGKNAEYRQGVAVFAAVVN